mmetsp:Transcript_36477/g.109606  ORF Transcript_36477/g.109606 Transcript_36477/m.109606 type:complete len:259 (-) Transcript_36477:2744-3520(-)
MAPSETRNLTETYPTLLTAVWAPRAIRSAGVRSIKVQTDSVPRATTSSAGRRPPGIPSCRYNRRRSASTTPQTTTGGPTSPRRMLVKPRERTIPTFIPPSPTPSSPWTTTTKDKVQRAETIRSINSLQIMPRRFPGGNRAPTTNRLTLCWGRGRSRARAPPRSSASTTAMRCRRMANRKMPESPRAPTTFSALAARMSPITIGGKMRGARAPTTSSAVTPWICRGMTPGKMPEVRARRPPISSASTSMPCRMARRKTL